MNYIIFHNKIYSDGDIDISAIEKACICVVDTDVELASAPEFPIEKKDSMLARKFTKLHPQSEYILQDEKIEDNVFQLVGIRAQKAREVYSLIPSDKVVVFIPYALAIRNYLASKNFALSEGIIFIDDLGIEKLITVFSGLKFSVTRTLATDDIESILSEIKRSQIGFCKKLEEFDSGRPDFLNVITNSSLFTNCLLKDEQGLKIECIDVPYPAIEGLKEIEKADTFKKFLLPEEVKSKKRKRELKEKVLNSILSILILAGGVSFALINKIRLNIAARECAQLYQQSQILGEELTRLDTNTYRDDLTRQKSFNYAVPYFKILSILPLSYEIYSFRYYLTDHWNLEALIFSKEGESFDDIPRINILKNALINECFIKDKPGKRIHVDL